MGQCRRLGFNPFGRFWGRTSRDLRLQKVDFGDLHRKSSGQPKGWVVSFGKLVKKEAKPFKRNKVVWNVNQETGSIFMIVMIGWPFRADMISVEFQECGLLIFLEPLIDPKRPMRKSAGLAGRACVFLLSTFSRVSCMVHRCRKGDHIDSGRITDENVESARFGRHTRDG